MMRKILSASVATALILGSVAPAYAQSYAFAEPQAPLGMTATVNLKVPLGTSPYKAKKASYGMTLGYGRQTDSLTTDGRIATRSAKLADLRFNAETHKVAKAEFASFDLANLDKDKRLNMGPEGDKTWVWIAAAVGVGVILWLVLDDDDDDDDDDDEVL